MSILSGFTDALGLTDSAGDYDKAASQNFQSWIDLNKQSLTDWQNNFGQLDKAIAATYNAPGYAEQLGNEAAGEVAKQFRNVNSQIDEQVAQQGLAGSPVALAMKNRAAITGSEAKAGARIQGKALGRQQQAGIWQGANALKSGIMNNIGQGYQGLAGVNMQRAQNARQESNATLGALTGGIGAFAGAGGFSRMFGGGGKSPYANMDSASIYGGGVNGNPNTYGGYA